MGPPGDTFRLDEAGWSLTDEAEHSLGSWICFDLACDALGLDVAVWSPTLRFLEVPVPGRVRTCFVKACTRSYRIRYGPAPSPDSKRGADSGLARPARTSRSYAHGFMQRHGAMPPVICSCFADAPSNQSIPVQGIFNFRGVLQLSLPDH